MWYSSQWNMTFHFSVRHAIVFLKMNCSFYLNRWYCECSRFCNGIDIFSGWHKSSRSSFISYCYQSRTWCNGHQQLNQLEYIWHSTLFGYSMVLKVILCSRCTRWKLGKIPYHFNHFSISFCSLFVINESINRNFYFFDKIQITLHSAGINYSAMSLLSTLIGLYVAFALNKFKLDWKIGVTCLVMYIAFLGLASMIELNMFFPVNLPTCPH